MNLLYTFIIFLVSCYSLAAQYTITPSQKPDIGDNYYYIEIDTINYFLGSSGANQIWNYTNLVIPSTPTISSISYVDASTLTNFIWYPGAYMAIVGSGGGFTSFDSDPNNYSLNWTKTMLGGATSTKYSDPLTKYHYPISFGSVFSDSVKYGAYYENPSSPFFVGLFKNFGSNSYSCSGYGTLNLPDGNSFSNTLKLNITYNKILIDEVTGDSTGYQNTEYEEYFSSISKFPILAYLKSDGYNTLPFNSIPTRYYTKSIRLNLLAITGLTDLEKWTVNVAIFPNPASTFNIKIDNESNIENPIFVLRNALGQEIETIINSISSTHYTLDMKKNIAGIYFLTIKTQKGQVTKKLLIE